MQATYTFSDADRDNLHQLLLGVTTSPYDDHDAFHREVEALADQAPDQFRAALDQVHHDRLHHDSGRPAAHLITNCPIDADLPYLDLDDVLADKYRSKHTFVAEGLLELQAVLLGTPIIAYTPRNNGDFFHDVHADNRFKGSQSQNTDGELHWHNERVTHPVRVDYIALLGLRSPGDDLVITKYVDGRDLRARLSSEAEEILRGEDFVTFFDEQPGALKADPGVQGRHAVLEDDHHLRYYDTRTRPADITSASHWRALWELRNAIASAPQAGQRIGERELFLFPNQGGLHSKQMIDIQDETAATYRWLLKTYTFRDEETAASFSEYWAGDMVGHVPDDGKIPG